MENPFHIRLNQMVEDLIHLRLTFGLRPKAEWVLSGIFMVYCLLHMMDGTDIVEFIGFLAFGFLNLLFKLPLPNLLILIIFAGLGWSLGRFARITWQKSSMTTLLRVGTLILIGLTCHTFIFFGYSVITAPPHPSP